MRQKGLKHNRREHAPERPTGLRYLLDFGLVLKQDLEQGRRKGRVGQQWDGRGCTKEACARKNTSEPAAASDSTHQSLLRVLTLFASLHHRVEQHLQGSRITETCKYLHDGGIWEKSLSPINSLKMVETSPG